MGLTFAAALCCGNVLNANNETNLTVSSRNHFQPGETLVTPHLTWLKPYAGARLRVLFVIPRSGMREVVELSQRMDMDYKVFSTQLPDKLSGQLVDPVPGDTLDERLASLEDLLEQDYDLIVYSSVNWNILPVEAQYALLKKVKQGAGFIGIIPKQDEIIEKALSNPTPASDQASLLKMLAGFPYPAVAPFSKATGIEDLANTTVQTALFGKGRMGIFKYAVRNEFHPLVPGPMSSILETDLTDYDFQLAYVIRLMLWAARREPGLEVTPATMVMNIDQKDNQDLTFDFVVNNPSEPEIVACEYMLLDRFGKKVCKERNVMKVKNGKNTAAMKIPWLPAGTYRAALKIRTTEGRFIDSVAAMKIPWLPAKISRAMQKLRPTAGRYIDFAAGVIQVKGNSAIKSMDLDQPGIRQGESIRGKILIENPSEQMKLRVSIWDSYNRLSAERYYPLNKPDAETRFEFNIDRPLTLMHVVRAELQDDQGRVIHSERRHFFISNLYPPKDEMRVVLWNSFSSNGTFFSTPVLRYFRSQGIDSQYSQPKKFNPGVLQANLWYIPYATRIIDKSEWGAKRSKDDLVRSPCLTDQKYRNELKTKLTENLQACKNYSVAEVSLGDECGFIAPKVKMDLCFSPTCIADFKRYIREQYQRIEILNAEYGTAFKSFDEVEPLPLEKARELNRLPLWVDHRLHMDTVWADIFDYGSKSVREIMPDARVGYEGSDVFVSTWSAADYWKLSRGMQLNNIYYEPFQAAAWRGFFTSDKILGLGWFGGYTSPCDKKLHPHTQYMPWNTLFKGANSLWIWHADPSGGSVTAPDYAFYDFFEESLRLIRAIKAGYGKALIRSRRLTDVGIYYSPASVHTATYLQPPKPEDAFFQNICQLLIDTGFQPRAYSYEEVKQGQLKDNPPEMLYMPYAQSLSPEESEEIRKYVEQGGLLIADIRPGVRDAHGKALAKGALDDVFGVKLSTEPDLKHSNSLSMPEEWKMAGKFAPLWYDPFTVAGAGKVIGKIDQAPAIIVNEYGRGKAVLLNFIMDNYLADAKRDAPDNFYRKLMRNLMALHSLQPDVKVAEDIPGLEITRFQNGRLTYVTFLRAMTSGMDMYDSAVLTGNTVTAHVTLPEKTCVYDMLKGQKIGRTRELTLAISLLEPIILACMPYEVNGIRVSLESGKIVAGDKINYTLAIQSNEPVTEEQIVRVRVFDPKGTEARHYGANVAVRGSQKVEIRTAINDRAGQWTLEATDCISGKKAGATWTLTGGHE